MVLPMPPEHLSDEALAQQSEAQLAELISRDSMIGVEVLG
jgi:hypothetical protein